MSTITKVIYLVRHGQSEDNIAPVYQAPTSPLSSTGQQQAEYIANRLSHISFDALISSPVLRAKQTAEAIAKKTQHTIEYNAVFQERIKPSSINGKSYDDPIAQATAQAWEHSLTHLGSKVEDGENFEDLMKRADEALDFIVKRPEKNLVVVSHGYFLRTMIARVLLGDTLTPENFQHLSHAANIENTGLTVLRLHGDNDQRPGLRLWTFNDQAHLAE